MPPRPARELPERPAPPETVSVARPEDQVGYLLVRIGHALEQRWVRDLAAYGLSARQHGVLGVLAADPGISAGAVSRQVMITPQSMGELLAGLEKRGLVVRQPPVGRGHPARLELTDAARALLAEVRPVVETSNSADTLGLTDDELQHLRTMLTKMLLAVTS